MQSAFLSRAFPIEREVKRSGIEKSEVEDGEMEDSEVEES